MTTQQVVSVLFVDCGEGYEIKHGDRAGQIRWTLQPRARFECVACNWASEVVTGPTAVRKFIDHIHDTHQAVCTAATTEGAQAA